MNELIKKARELCEKGRKNGYSVSIENCIVGLCDALEEAQKELIDYHHTKKTVDGKMAENARLRRINEQLTARAEKAEAERDAYKAALQKLEYMISNEKSGNRKREHSIGVCAAAARARELLKGE
ncbi:MAG: hypothetical protein WCT05_15690 [Lentisphaeria bacterium]